MAAASDRTAAISRFNEALALDARLRTGKGPELSKTLSGLYTLRGLSHLESARTSAASVAFARALKLDTTHVLARKKLHSIRVAQRKNLVEAWYTDSEGSATASEKPRKKIALDVAFDE